MAQRVQSGFVDLQLLEGILAANPFGEHWVSNIQNKLGYMN